jgi:hypothetical protein
MTVKKSRRAPGFNVQQAFAAHVEASLKAHSWAEKTLALRRAGKASQANEAENKAKFWLRKMLMLEDQAGHGKPRGGRAEAT